MIKIKRLHSKAVIPKYHTSGASGLDLVSIEDVVLHPDEYSLVPTGIAIALPMGFEGQIRPRSGLARTYGITVLNSPGTIDSDYRGEIKVLIINHSPFTVKLPAGTRIAQLVITVVARLPIETVDELDETGRGGEGFGSTGER